MNNSIQDSIIFQIVFNTRENEYIVKRVYFNLSQQVMDFSNKP